jgi:tRNA threonylcarbamoyladenosine biosynthesis protein TsaB
MSDYILHIETATKVCSVAVSLNGELISCKESSSDEFIHGEQLTNYISEVISSANIQLENIAAVSVSSGPGSYTGLRIGVSTAKGLCFGLSIPLIAVPSLSSLIFLAKERHPNTTICAMFDARRMEVFRQVVDENRVELVSVGPQVLDEYSMVDFEPFLAVGDGTNKIKELWRNRNVQFDDSIVPSAKGQRILANQKLKAQDFEDIAYFVPNYGKEFYSP